MSHLPELGCPQLHTSWTLCLFAQMVPCKPQKEGSQLCSNLHPSQLHNVLTLITDAPAQLFASARNNMLFCMQYDMKRDPFEQQGVLCCCVHEDACRIMSLLFAPDYNTPVTTEFIVGQQQCVTAICKEAAGVLRARSRTASGVYFCSRLHAPFSICNCS